MPPLIEVGALRLDPRTHQVWRGEEEIQLSQKEFALVETLMRRPGRIEFHVEDGGSGFPPAFLPHAFDRFTRGSDARERGGAGLGLSIVEVIARAHGGSAHAINRPGGGADVWLSLPVPAVSR